MMGYIKTFKKMFKSARRREDEFKANVQEQFGKGNKEAYQLTVIFATIVTFIVITFGYVFTASVLGSMGMILVASLLIISSFFSSLRLLNYVLEIKDYRVTFVDSLFNWIGLFYLISFFIMIFI